jgi:hypothetical protein
MNPTEKYFGRLSTGFIDVINTLLNSLVFRRIFREKRKHYEIRLKPTVRW